MPPSLNQDFYNLRNLRVSLRGGKGSGIIDIHYKRNPQYAEKWPGQSLVPSQSYNGENFPTISATIYNDADLSFGTVVPNSSIEDFEMISPNDADAIFLEDLLTLFPLDGWVFGGPDTTINGKDNTTFTIDIMTNVMNPGAGGGFPA